MTNKQSVGAGRNVVVVGTQWGDEGKGKLVDWLTEKSPGVVRFQGEEYRGQHEALIPDELWERANAAVRETRPRVEVRADQNIHQYLLKGICRCGHCGRAMIPQTCGDSNNARKRYRYYNCGSVLRDRMPGGCPGGRLSPQARAGSSPPPKLQINLSLDSHADVG